MGDTVGTASISIAGIESTIIKKGVLYTSDDRVEEVQTSTIDEECIGKQIGLIKMDVEGFEYYAMKGGVNTIKENKPVLLISAYHTGKDFFEIPPMIKAIDQNYKLHFIDLSPKNPVVEWIILAYV